MEVDLCWECSEVCFLRRACPLSAGSGRGVLVSFWAFQSARGARCAHQGARLEESRSGRLCAPPLLSELPGIFTTLAGISVDVYELVISITRPRQQANSSFYVVPNTIKSSIPSSSAPSHLERTNSSSKPIHPTLPTFQALKSSVSLSSC